MSTPSIDPAITAAHSVANLATIKWIGDGFGGEDTPYAEVDETQAAAAIRQAYAPLLTAAHEALSTLSHYPVASTYPDGPCLTSYDMGEVEAALAALNAALSHS